MLLVYSFTRRRRFTRRPAVVAAAHISENSYEFSRVCVHLYDATGARAHTHTNAHTHTHTHTHRHNDCTQYQVQDLPESSLMASLLQGSDAGCPGGGSTDGEDEDEGGGESGEGDDAGRLLRECARG